MSGSWTAAQIDPRISSPARTARATRGNDGSPSALCTGTTSIGSSLRYSSWKTPRSSSCRAKRSGTWRPSTVSMRAGSASCCRPEKATTLELRSSMVTGAFSRVAIALASANRSPDGMPPSVVAP
ncbi:hypothetical protein [Microbacterium sp. Se63.02b]|uniref:hypothetical protein n=1 Tax=Microbacterium sp. Se63.02b TaxID=2709304 RepID=UPI00191ECF37|nr:hypothetical protein [Microbacterium sp. Se63.02b]